MNKVFLSITGCALALGLVAAPVASAKTPSHTKVTAKHVSHKAKATKHAVHTAKATAKHVAPEVKVTSKHVSPKAQTSEHAVHTAKATAKHVAPIVKASAKHASAKTHGSKGTAKKAAHYVSPAKLKEVQKFLSPINKNISKVDTNLKSLTQSITNFYATPATSEQELDFFNGSLGKLNAESKQLSSYKKQLDHLSKKYGSADALTSAYQKVSDLQTAITNEVTTLNDLHASFVPVASPAPAPTTTTPTEPTNSDPTATTPTTTDPTTSTPTASDPTSTGTTTSTPSTSTGQTAGTTN